MCLHVVLHALLHPLSISCHSLTFHSLSQSFLTLLDHMLSIFLIHSSLLLSLSTFLVYLFSLSIILIYLLSCSELINHLYHDISIILIFIHHLLTLPSLYPFSTCSPTFVISLFLIWTSKRYVRDYRSQSAFGK